MKDLKLGMQLGYWGAGPDPRMVSVAQEAERLGYDAIFTAEAWGCLLYTSPSPRDGLLSRMPSSA